MRRKELHWPVDKSRKASMDIFQVQVWPAFRHWKLWDIWRRYFRTCIILPEPPLYDQKMHYLLAQFPHASFPMAGKRLAQPQHSVAWNSSHFPTMVLCCTFLTYAQSQ